jgi:hypothetical protein
MASYYGKTEEVRKVLKEAVVTYMRIPEFAGGAEKRQKISG